MLLEGLYGGMVLGGESRGKTASLSHDRVDDEVGNKRRHCGRSGEPVLSLSIGLRLSGQSEETESVRARSEDLWMARASVGSGLGGSSRTNVIDRPPNVVRFTGPRSQVQAGKGPELDGSVQHTTSVAYGQSRGVFLPRYKTVSSTGGTGSI